MQGRLATAAMLLVVGAMFALLVPPSASAHVLQPVGTTVVQDFGPYQLTATMSAPNTLPGPLSVQIAPEQSFSGAVAITLWLVPAGAPLNAPPLARVISAQGTIDAQFPVSQPGDYELALQVSGQNGGGAARVPVTVTQPSASWVAAVISAALGMFVLIVGGAMVLRIALHRRRRSLSARTNVLLTSSMTVCAVIAFVAFIATQFIPANTATAVPNAASDDRSNVNLDMQAEVQPARAGQPVDLVIDVTDSQTGVPIDDLVPDHNALMHLFIVSADRGFFQHIYPARSTPGQFLATFTPDRPGEYTAYVEVSRTLGGPQVFARGLSVNGPVSDVPAGDNGDVSVAVTKSPTNVIAVAPAVLTFTFAASGRAVTLAPHLRLAGDLVVANSDGTVFGHVQASDLATGNPLDGGVSIPMTAPTQAPLGPTVHFAYTFPAPGHYTVWAEVKRADTGLVVTGSTSVDVAPAAPTS